jgi:hypothetical protein
MINKNHKKSSFAQSSENQDLDPYMNQTLQSEGNDFLIPKNKKKISLRKSIQNCESSNLLSVKKNQEENVERFSRRSKTEDEPGFLFPETIEDIKVGHKGTSNSDEFSFNIYGRQNTKSRTCSDLSISKSK